MAQRREQQQFTAEIGDSECDHLLETTRAITIKVVRY
jgi:hypothetical protein